MVRLGSAALGLALIAYGSAHAQTQALEAYTRGRNIAVTERPHPDYDAVGVPLGGFRLFPTLGGELEYTDNVYATNTDKVSDGLFRLTPGFALSSDWSQNALGLTANVGHEFHFSQSNQDNTTYLVQGSGRYDVTPDASLSLVVASSLVTEAREQSTAAAQAIDPTQYTLNSVQLTGVDQIGRLRLQGIASFASSRYEDQAAFDGTQVLNTQRDDDLSQLNARADVAVTQDTAIFASLGYNNRDFANNTKESSHGYQLLIGTNFDITTLMRGEFGIGYLSQEQKLGGDRGGLAASGQILYFPTQLTTVTLAASRSFVDSTVVDSPGDVETVVSLRVDHELLRNVLLFARATYSREDFTQQAGTQNRYTVAFGASYLLNRGISLNASYQHDTQTSTGSLASYNYDSNYVYMGVTLQR